jgi:hypothetical protein
MEKKTYIFCILLILVIIILIAVFAGGRNRRGVKPDNTIKNDNFNNVTDIVKSNNVCTKEGGVKEGGAGVVAGGREGGARDVQVYQKQSSTQHYRDVMTAPSSQPSQPSQNEESESYCTEATVPEETIDVSPYLPPRFMSSLTENEWWEDSRKRSKPESICKKTLQKIYGVKFSTVRPDWLRNPKTGRPMELDCYNEELKIGLEYQGIHHYRWPNWTGQSKQDWIDQVERDRLKVDLCDLHGVYLVSIPYNLPLKHIPDYISFYLPHNVERRQKYGIDV